MKEIELIEKRKPREKHFLQKNGVIVANVYDEDIHFLKDGIYEEIDNSLIDIGDYYMNKMNSYNVKFAKNSHDGLTILSIGNNYIETKLITCNTSIIRENTTKSKLHKNLCYSNILKNIDIEYNILPTKVKESIILKDRDIDIDKITFSIKTNLTIKKSNSGKIQFVHDDKIYFEFEPLYMVDSNFNINYNLFYDIKKITNNEYVLKLNIDKEWLNNDKTVYPIIIDPTITNFGENNSVYDTYIYEGDTNIDRNSQDMLKVGVENINGTNRIYRTLLKFSLPNLGTGSQVISANLNLRGYPIQPANYTFNLLTAHQITEDWDETTANWSSMNDKYNPLVEGIIFAIRGTYNYETEMIEPGNCGGDITRLVKKWYTGTPNYGIMLKHNNLKFNSNSLPIFYSKDNNITGVNPKPILEITYRNQNGIESYMDYQKIDFSIGTSYVNNYNGNLTSIFDVGSTIAGKSPINLSLIYNTNDIVLQKDNGVGLGYKFNLFQTIKEQPIEDDVYLEYMDEDGTLHYFINRKISFDDNGYNVIETDNLYYDEDGLNYEITKNNTNYILKDNNGNIMTFVINGDRAYLSEITDESGNITMITYDNNNRIIKIVDPNNQEINVTYDTSSITITSSNKTYILNYENNKLTSISSILGTIRLEYYDTNVIKKIIDVNNLKVEFEYYPQKPYKIKKVSNYSTQNTLGNYFELSYGFDSTTITDSSGKQKNLIFNSQGGVSSISSLNSTNSLKNAYGISQINGTNQDGLNANINNKLLQYEIPIKYVKNYLTNTSFEKSSIDFVGSNDLTFNITTEESETGFKSLKAISTSSNQILSKDVIVPKDNFYTFSAYLKNDSNVQLKLYYIDNNNEIIESVSDIISASNSFERADVTIEYPETATSNLFINICMLNTGTIYIDDIQLEEGKVSNNYNLLENSDFSSGISDWTLYAGDYDTGENVSTQDKFEIITLNDGTTALKTKKNPAYYIGMEKSYDIKGCAGDVFNLSFWYKNEGINSNLSMDYGSRVNIYFNYVNSESIEDGHCILSTEMLNTNDQNWQYISNNFTAERDYTSIVINFNHVDDANDIYITNLNLFKNIRCVNYEYDENGNIILQKNLDNSSSEFKYGKNNELIKITNPRGKSYCYEYDNNIPNRVINNISDMGISNIIKYDADGNPILTKIINNIQTDELVNGTYKLRLKGTDNYIRNIDNKLIIGDDSCSHDLWLLEKIDNYYRISHSISNVYIKVRNEELILGDYDEDDSLFELILQDNKSYLIKIKDQEKYIQNSNGQLSITELENQNNNFEFYVETSNNKYFIESSATYSNDGRFITSLTDCLLNKTEYNYDNITGNINYIRNSKKQVTRYTYDEMDRLISVNIGNKQIEYEYFSDGRLKKIIEGDREYVFEYDEFLNTKSIKVGNNIILITNNYDEHDGNLLSVSYGNNDIISYTYDYLNRVNDYIKMDDTYHYEYDNNGEIRTITSNNDIIKYTYDLSKKLTEYKFNNFVAKYQYDVNGNVINQNYKLDNINSEIENTFNADDAVTKTRFDNSIISYEYDGLGRMTSSSINNVYNTNYKYLSKGNRTSLLIKNMKNDFLDLSYKYDELNNLKAIYKNGKLVNKYYYDQYNQLVKEINVCLNQMIVYSYDNFGNLLNKKIYNYKTKEFISSNKYKYENTWKDQLTEFNNTSIQYDSIGNPIKIGDNILSWTNGRELVGYNSNVYKYNKDGIRIRKVVNDVITNYYLDDDKIIYEKTGDNVLYYMYNDVDDLIGFKYNSDVFYYIKNIQDDIIGIMDQNYNLVAKYEYDSFGNIISILDSENNDISSNALHIANINPYRYRSYYYDKESKLYYLNSRYYNPLWGRFINCDNMINQNKDILGYNLYAYCSNNFINFSDYTGQGLISNIIKKIKKLFSSSKKTKKSSSKKPKVCPAKTIKKNVSTKQNLATNFVAPRSLPLIGPPNSTAEKRNGDKRHYGPDGKADYDTDSSHPDHHPELENPHQHDWSWDGDKATRGKAHNPDKKEETAKIALDVAVVAGTAYIAYRIIRFVPSLLPPFWWSIPLNAATP